WRSTAAASAATAYRPTPTGSTPSTSLATSGSCCARCGSSSGHVPSSPWTTCSSRTTKGSPMANRTSQKSKSERAQALMREQQRKERMRNFSVIGAVVLAIVIIGGVLFYVQSSSDKTGQTAQDVPSNLSGTYNVVVGKSSAPTTIKLYEDLQCPI